MSCDVDGSRGILDHDGGLHRVLRGDSDGEGAVVAHQDSSGAMTAERLDDPAADRVVADDRERADGDRAPEFVGHAGDDARDLLPPRGPRHGVGRVGVDHSAHLRHVPIHIGVRGGVARRAPLASRRAGHDVAFEVAQDHVLRVEVVVRDAGRLDDEEICARHPAGDVPARPDHEPVPDEFIVQARDIGTDGFDGFANSGVERRRRSISAGHDSSLGGGCARAQAMSCYR